MKKGEKDSKRGKQDCDADRLGEIIEKGKNMAVASGAQIQSFDKELEEIERNEREAWRRLSFLL